MSKKIKLLALLLGGIVMMLGLSGCRYFVDRKFSDLEKVYPTQNAYDLFKVFPKGFHIYHIKRLDSLTFYINVDGKMNGEESIQGDLEIVENHETVIQTDLTVEKDGTLSFEKSLPEKYQERLNSFQFLFQVLDLSKDNLKTMKKNGVRTNATGGYFAYYLLESKLLTDYLQSPDGEIGLSMQGYESLDEKYDFDKSVSIGRETNSVTETVYSGGKND